MPTLDLHKLPKHVAIIMDGNGRWAKKRTMNRIRGHEQGTESVRVVVRTTRELGIPWLTLYAFSEENWKRSNTEVKALMRILKQFLKSELQEMQDNDIRFMTIGRIDKLPDDVQQIIHHTVEETSRNSAMVLTLALSYGSRQEILQAVQGIAAGVEAGRMSPDRITEKTIADALFTAGAPDPDLLIRTSGEYRISNFLLWQIAYTEIYITPVLWPDFRKEEYLGAIAEYQKRERRFGGAIETQ
jgi:undecaprenyl diphosphate synthase